MLAPTTQLDAVNLLLSTIGQAPVNTLTGQVSVDVLRAQQILDHINREVQANGCTFNQEDDYPLGINTSGNILIPPNLISVTLDPNYYPPADFLVVIRGTMLYNKIKHTYVFTKPLKAQVILMLDYEDLPQYARWFIAVRAARKFQDDSTQSDSGHQFTTQDEQSAFQSFKRREAQQEDRTMLTPFYQRNILHPRTPF